MTKNCTGWGVNSAESVSCCCISNFYILLQNFCFGSTNCLLLVTVSQTFFYIYLEKYHTRTFTSNRAGAIETHFSHISNSKQTVAVDATHWYARIVYKSGDLNIRKCQKSKWSCLLTSLSNIHVHIIREKLSITKLVSNYLGAARNSTKANYG